MQKFLSKTLPIGIVIWLIIFAPFSYFFNKFGMFDALVVPSIIASVPSLLFILVHSLSASRFSHSLRTVLAAILLAIGAIWLASFVSDLVSGENTSMWYALYAFIVLPVLVPVFVINEIIYHISHRNSAPDTSHKLVKALPVLAWLVVIATVSFII